MLIFVSFLLIFLCCIFGLAGLVGWLGTYTLVLIGACCILGLAALVGCQGPPSRVGSGPGGEEWHAAPGAGRTGPPAASAMLAPLRAPSRPCAAKCSKSAEATYANVPRRESPLNRALNQLNLLIVLRKLPHLLVLCGT